MSRYEEIEELFDNGELDTTYPPSVYDAYLEYKEEDAEWLADNYREASREIGDNYIGHYESREDFICEGLDLDPTDKVNAYLVIDYDASWERNFRHEYFEYEGHYFSQF